MNNENEMNILFPPGVKKLEAGLPPPELAKALKVGTMHFIHSCHAVNLLPFILISFKNKMYWDMEDKLEENTLLPLGKTRGIVIIIMLWSIVCGLA